jgi:uncharacterized protein (DUF2236 family)
MLSLLPVSMGSLEEEIFTAPRISGWQAPQGGPGSMPWKLHKEVVLLLGWGRAILLQLAHPLVAQGVAEHSVFLAQPGARLERLRKTIDSMLALTFGEPWEVASAASAINAIHDRVRGTLKSSTKIFMEGTCYSARNAELLKWVHATLLDSFILTYQICVGSLTAEQKDAYCYESSSAIEPLLGIPTGYLPRSADELRQYMAQVLGSGELEVTETARLLGKAVLYPALPWWARSFMPLMRLFTIGTLPPSFRTAYGYSWNDRQQKALKLSTQVIRCLLVCAPSVLRHWRAARVGEKRRRNLGSRVL